MLPLSFQEMVNHHGLLEEGRMLAHRLVYGHYPEVVTSPGNERSVLREMSDSYLFKDILAWGAIKKSDRLVRLLQALALQVGSHVSYTELGRTCGIDHKTVEAYINLLEQSYIVFRLGSFSRNLRSELKKSRKIYFYDNGVRNAVLANFALLEARADIGQLWENYLVAERIKALGNHGVWANTWFWRTTQQKEIDFVEEKDGAISAYEFKWNPDALVRQPRDFLEAYPGSSFEVVHRQNLEGFLML
jgi:predicted AAA+ superfamily ATPase